MSYVKITKPIGTTVCMDCVADVFATDVLTVTCTDETLDVMATFAPDAWVEATTYDDRGYPLATLVNARMRLERTVEDAQRGHRVAR